MVSIAVRADRDKSGWPIRFGMSGLSRAWTTVADAVDVAFRVVTEPAVALLESATEAKAMRDPVYRHLKETHTAGEDVSLDGWMLLMELEDKHRPHPWWEEPVRVLRNDPARHLCNEIRWAGQRLVHGWDERAVWNLDLHLARQLSEQLLFLAEQGNGWPAMDEYPTAKDWQAALRLNANRLAAYASRFSRVEQAYRFGATDEQVAALEESLTEGAQEALRWVADRLPALWD